jgi:hypothetical protein
VESSPHAAMRRAHDRHERDERREMAKLDMLES